MRPPFASVLLLALVLLIANVPASAWTLEGHRSIALDALTVLPPQMREALSPHLSSLLAGVEEPDFFRVVSHKIPIISLRGTPPPPRSGAADALRQFATNAQEMLRLGRDPWDVLFVVGQATHFVQDLNQPLHAGWDERLHPRSGLLVLRLRDRPELVTAHTSTLLRP